MLSQKRLSYKPLTPDLSGAFQEIEGGSLPKKELQKLFPKTFGQKLHELKKGTAAHKNLKIGVVFSGGQAPGGHNVITGLFDSGAKIIGFLGGPSGIVENKFQEIKNVDAYRNQGGFDMIGSGRTKIETEEQLASSLKTIQSHGLDGLVIIGGDDSNTNAAVMAEYFLHAGCKTRVVGVPKTIDGDLQSKEIEISFGFDSAAKVYAELIGNIARDALSAKKYYHFIRLMGRSASHLTLECALATNPNLTLISEEKKSMDEVVGEIADLIEKRRKTGKEYGIILIPEGLIESMPQLETLNLEKDPHGNVMLSQIETEKLLVDLVKKRGVKFNAITHFFGYEGRACLPSNFDANYCYTLGKAAAIAIRDGLTGVVMAVQNLKSSPTHWTVKAVPIVRLMHFEERNGKLKPVIQKTLVDIKGISFIKFRRLKSELALEDRYLFPGPMQFYGDSEITETVPITLKDR